MEQCLDCITRMTLELSYQKHLQNPSQYKRCNFKSDYVLHFDEFEKYDDSGNITFQCYGTKVVGDVMFLDDSEEVITVPIKFKVLRVDPYLSVPARANHSRFYSSDNFFPQNSREFTYQESSYFWIVKKYLEINGVNDLLPNLMDGLN